MNDENRTLSRQYLESLAAGKHNDAVKLLFLAGELDGASIDAMELDQIAELKRDAKGAIEIKFIDKLAVLRELSGLESAETVGDADSSFYAALDKAARELGMETHDAI